MKRSLIFTTSLSALLIGGVASAQDIATLDEIVIGAGENKDVSDTAQGVTVLGQEEIDQEQSTTVGEIVDNSPGVQTTGSDNVLGQSFNIRGIGTNTNAAESQILINVDGTQKYYEQYRLGSFFSDPEMLKRAEILRGPASSTLYGSGATGGVINLETKDASDFLGESDNFIKGKVRYDSNTEGLTYSTIFAKRAGNAEMLLNLNYRDFGDLEYANGEPLEGSAFEATSGLAKLNYTLSDDSQIELSYSRFFTEGEAQLYDQITFNPDFGYIDRKVIDETYALQYENAFSGNDLLNLKVALTHSNTENEQTNATSPFWSDTVYAYTSTNLDINNVSQFSTGFAEHYLTTGIDLSYRERIADSETGGLGYHPEGTEKRIGIYAQDEIHLTDKLLIIPGLRLDYFEQEAADSVSAQTRDEGELAFSPKIAALYDITDNVGVFGSLAKTERLPTIDELFSERFGLIPNLDLHKETSINYEFGITAKFDNLLQTGDALRFKLTGFKNNIEDKIEAGTIGVDTVSYVNIGEAEYQGFEVESNYSTDFVYANLGFSKAEAINSATGDLLDSSPADNLSLTIGMKLPQYDLQVAWNFNHYAETEYADGTVYDAYGVHGLDIAWLPDEGALQGLEFRVGIDNILDTDYQNSLSEVNGTGRNVKFTIGKSIAW